MTETRHSLWRPRATFFWPNSNKTYQGQWLNGLRHGYGVQVYENGNKYQGEWKDDRRDGHGSYFKYFEEEDLSELIYKGGFKDDQRDGFGTYYFPNGDRYEGEWEKNIQNGFGVFFYASDGMGYPEIFRGDWRQGRRHGRGVVVLPNGDCYVGSFENDLCHGPGMFYFVQTRRKLAGMWSNGICKCGSYEDWSEEDSKTVEDVWHDESGPWEGVYDMEGVEKSENVISDMNSDYFREYQSTTAGGTGIDTEVYYSEQASRERASRESIPELHDLAPYDEREDSRPLGKGEVVQETDLEMIDRLLEIPRKPDVAPLIELELRNPVEVLNRQIQRHREMELEPMNEIV